MPAAWLDVEVWKRIEEQLRDGERFEQGIIQAAEKRRSQQGSITERLEVIADLLRQLDESMESLTIAISMTKVATKPYAALTAELDCVTASYDDLMSERGALEAKLEPLVGGGVLVVGDQHIHRPAGRSFYCGIRRAPNAKGAAQNLALSC